MMKLRIQAIGTLLMGTLFAVFIFICFYCILKDPFALALTLGLECFAIVGFLIIWYRDKIFINHLNIGSEASFESMITVLLFMGICFLIGWSIIAYFSSQTICFAIGFSFFYSIFWMFLRRKAYDKTTELYKRNEGIGYHPACYWLLGSVCGIGLFISFFNGLLSSSIVYCFVSFILSFGLLSLILSPDLTDRIVPFDIKKISGFSLYSILSIVLSLMLTILLN